MAIKFKNGTTVQQVMPAPVVGTVSRFVFDETSGEISYVVSSTDAEGVVHERVFAEDSIQEAR